MPKFTFPKAKKPFLFLSGLLFVAISSCNPKPKYTQTPEYFTKYVEDFYKASIAFDSVATAFKLRETPLDSLRKSLENTRLAYKKIEFWTAYRYPAYAGDHFNGAPLLHIEKSGNQPAVLPPKGLQILDEMVFSDEAEENRSQIASLAKMLRNDFRVLYPEMQIWQPNLQEITNALRMQLVRVFTLGTTGFDTPGSLNGLEETKVSLRSMSRIVENNPRFQDYSQKKKVLELFEDAIGFLEKGNFKNFDRLGFLTDYIDPLYKILGESISGPQREYFALATAWNPESTSIFSNDFLNPYFYTELSARENSHALKSLGKKLFYDPAISNNGKMSCVSCHQPEKAFTDGRAKSSSNVHGKAVLRNAPTLVNAVYADRYFYDLRAFSLEQQVEHVIFNPMEFNTAYSEILEKLEADETYKKQFEKLFEEDKITRENLTKALASFVMSLRSFDSKFDRYVRGETNQIDPSVKNGFNLFMGKANCATCHFPPTFSGLVPPVYRHSESEILGVLKKPDSLKPEVDEDLGRYASGVSSEKAWIYEKSFKTTTVRNVELTAPYFHNGAYKTLEEVMDFYNKGGGAGMGLEVKNQTLSDDPLNLTQKEIADLIAFMESLTDNPFGKASGTENLP